MMNCNNCFLAGTRVCTKELNPLLESCDYFITEKEAIEQVIHKKEYPKIMKENAIRDKEEREKHLRKRILSIRFRLEQECDSPWNFSIVNRFTDEQIENLIKENEDPGEGYKYQEDIYITYGGSEKELVEVVVKNIKEWIKNSEDLIEEIKGDIVKDETTLNSLSTPLEQ